MKREASLHVTESKLKEILKKAFTNVSDDLVKYVLSEAYKHSVNNRSLLISNDKLQRSATKMLEAPLDHTLTMARIIYQVRKDKNHRGIIISKPGTRDWDMIKDITKNAIQFCEDYHMGYRQGFIEYIKLAIDKMQKFGLNKITSMHDGICEDWAGIEELMGDPNPGLTERAYKEYNKFIYAKMSTIMVDYSKIPAKYICFMKAAQAAVKLKATPELYIKAQFKGLDWQQGVPDPMQLIGDKATERFQKYVYEFGGAEKKEGPDKSLVDKLKNLKNK